MKTPHWLAMPVIALAATVMTPCLLSAEQPGLSHHDIIYQYAEEIRCAADDMKSEIKEHFRGTKGYGRMLGANAVVRAKAAAIQRRVRRDACYRRLEKDAAGLDKLVCELNERYLDILTCATPRRPICGDTFHVEAKLARMRELSLCLQAEACRRLGLAPPAVVLPARTNYQPAPGPVIVQPEILEPQIQPIVPHNTMRSVLDSDPAMTRPRNPNRSNR